MSVGTIFNNKESWFLVFDKIAKGIAFQVAKNNGHFHFPGEASQNSLDFHSMGINIRRIRPQIMSLPLHTGWPMVHVLTSLCINFLFSKTIILTLNCLSTNFFQINTVYRT